AQPHRTRDAGPAPGPAGLGRWSGAVGDRRARDGELHRGREGPHQRRGGGADHPPGRPANARV
ncbi:MAG: hypothetical protein AVDCRST_MAG08-4435, partial [uncultured Acetobacteraceae bacterium]